MKVIINGLYKHFKGNIYKVLNIATNTETGRDMVIYKNINDEKLWVRPIEIFTSKIVHVDGLESIDRFKFLEIDKNE